MRLLRSADVDALGSIELGLSAAETAARIVATGRLTTGRLQVGDDVIWSRVLMGILPDLDLIGYKQFHRVGKRVRYHIALSRYSTGDAIGIVDGRRVTSLRTASTAALAHRRAVGDRPVALAVIGSGEEAREGLRAVAGSSSIEAALIYSPTQANREALAREAQETLGVPAIPAASVTEAVGDADAAYIATSAQSPVVEAADVAHLDFVAAVGATRPDHHELRGDVFTAASLVVLDCLDAAEEPGDAIEATTRYDWRAERAVLLGSWLDAGRSDADGMTLFKSIGSVEQDLVLAFELVQAAEDGGVGEVIEQIGSLRMMR